MRAGQKLTVPVKAVNVSSTKKSANQAPQESDKWFVKIKIVKNKSLAMFIGGDERNLRNDRKKKGLSR